MIKCIRVSYYGGHSWPWECAVQVSWSKPFQELLTERDDAFLRATRAKSDNGKNFWRSVIDNINQELNKIRINETTLRPAKYP